MVTHILFWVSASLFISGVVYAFVIMHIADKELPSKW